MPELPPEVREALEALLEYNWDDEREDAMVQMDENDADPNNHIFARLVTVSNWLCGTDRTVESYLEAKP